jgi:glucosamine--fructose-6-phosphate aminotransferase (isomerizing)
MPNKLWDDIQAQEDNLRRVVEHLYGAERPKVEAAARFLDNGKPTAFIGVASAEYLCMPAEVYLGQHGRYASTLTASDALYSMLPSLKNANVVINSRSGETVEVVKLCKALAGQDTPYALVTNEPASTAAGLAAHVVWTNTRKDELVSINVVTGMMTATLILAGAMVGEMDAIRPELNRLCMVLGDAVRLASARAESFYQLLKNSRPIYLIYRGHSKGSAHNGRLVLEEVSRTPGIAIEAAEFRQGPNEVIDERFGAVLFVPGGKQGELNLSLRADILRSGGRVLLVGSFNGLEAAQNEVLFPIPGLPDFLRPVAEVVPVQLLAYQLARGQGYNPGDVRYISKVILTEEGIPNQG